MTPIGQLTGGVDRQAVMEFEGLAIFAYTFHRLLAFRDRAITIPPSTHDVETLQRESGWVHFAVTRRAAGVVAMFLKLLANRYCATNVRFDGADRRWWRDVDSEDSLH